MAISLRAPRSFWYSVGRLCQERVALILDKKPARRDEHRSCPQQWVFLLLNMKALGSPGLACLSPLHTVLKDAKVKVSSQLPSWHKSASQVVHGVIALRRWRQEGQFNVVVVTD